ncbi:MAG: CoA-binding protein [Candidatus Sumerlaeaceae bacterium]
MRVAIVGASSNRSKFGNKAVRSYVAQGHEVVPINPNEAEVEGLNTYAKVSDISGPVDRVLLYVPPAVGVKVLDDIKAKGVAETYVNPGADSDELFERAGELGVKTIFACAIVDIGDSPGRY